MPKSFLRDVELVNSVDFSHKKRGKSPSVSPSKIVKANAFEKEKFNNIGCVILKSLTALAMLYRLTKNMHMFGSLLSAASIQPSCNYFLYLINVIIRLLCCLSCSRTSQKLSQ